MPKLLLLLLLLAGPCHAALEVSPGGAGAVGLGGYLQYLEDPAGTLDFANVVQLPAGHWHSHPDSTFSRGYNDSTWWLRFSLYNPGPNTIERLLEVAYPNLDQVNIWVQSQAGLQHIYRLGDSLPFHSRPLQTRNFVAPFTLPVDQTVDVYLQIRSKSSVQVPLTLWQPTHFHTVERNHNLMQGFYFGAVLVMALYNFFVYLAVREKAFIYYVGFVVCLSVFIASLKGFAFEYLWPHHPQWNDAAIVWSLGLSILFAAKFIDHFLRLHQFSRYLEWVALAPKILVMLILLSYLVLPYRLVITMLIPLTTISCLYAFGLGAALWYRGYHRARYYTLGWSALLSGGIALALNKVNLLPANALTEHTLQLGSTMEVILLSFALAESINEDRRLRSEAQRQSLDTERRLRREREEALTLEQRLAQDLEAQVQRRSRELELANRRLLELSDTDQLTGLKNRRYLNRVLVEELTRSFRYQHPLAVLLLDVDHFKQFNDRFGHIEGDRCLQRVARVLQQTTRHTADCAVRYGGEEFCLILPETDARGAEDLAERIRKNLEHLPLQINDEFSTITVSLGIAVMQPGAAPDADNLLQQADKALYSAKQTGRNRVVVARETQTVDPNLQRGSLT
ncbi:MAG: diguanylate cyclase [Pseudomonadales bacterium]|mgnify:CR=1 FL=1|nr:diguanylate cyclase [Pseudomonadales bacterium]